ncbi:hypothetical protein SeMB42_g01809 [Synchytrium endobioticum]|uniref:Uncharacterized protein n=1 Tax=Synchytrium endobioticum TaxID=286115 RepID=A0A507DDN8_9FUNG|nr:hypothetical protein SeLEV6574_g01509 [Synchytrium endobioticum]TPX51774.1 hypothetical protein SeMB42_g01809 [Synchytrium endobioticum]
MLFPIKLPSSEWMSILLSVSITLSSLVLSSPIPAGSTGFPRRNANNQASSSGEAPPTTEQLRQWIWLLRERRFNLAELKTEESYDMVQNLASLEEENAYYIPPNHGRFAQLQMSDLTLNRMMTYVIPEGIPLIFDDLMKEPSRDMTPETLKFHIEALKNLDQQYAPFRHHSVVIRPIATLLQKYRDRFQDVVEATYLETGLGEVSLPQAPPTKEQLPHCIWLLRKRRAQLAQRTLKWECDELDFIIETRLKSRAYQPGMPADEAWPDFILESMLPYVIPDEVGLTFDVLMAKPTAGMDLEMLAYHWEALENLHEPLRLAGRDVPRVEILQRLYTYSIVAVAGPAAFGQKEPCRRDNLLVPETASADIRNPVSTPADHSAAARAKLHFSNRGLTSSSGVVASARTP